MPNELKSCKVYILTKEGSGREIVVIKCPNAETSVSNSSGKSKVFSSIVDEPPQPPAPETLTVEGKTYRLEK